MREWNSSVKRSDAELLDALERLVDGGACPGVINDDNGHWAVAEDGIQNCCFGEEPQDLSTTFFIEARKFRSTIREAIDAYLDDVESEPDGSEASG